MMRKVIVYWSSGGLEEVVRYAFARLNKRIYNTSKTAYLYRDLNQIPAVPCEDAFRFKIISNSEELELLRFKRIEMLRYHKWFAKGSNVVVGFHCDRPVSFSWGHFQTHQVDQASCVDLGENTVWIGPTFVDKSMRGKGINKAQIAYQIANLPTSINACLTSANENNLASIRSFKGLGFKDGALVLHRQGILSRTTLERRFSGRGELFIRFIDHD